MRTADPITAEAAHHLAQALAVQPGIAGLHSGDFGEVALLYPGDRVAGLRLTRDDNNQHRLEVHVIADSTADSSLQDRAERIREISSSITALPVDVVFADIA